MEETDIATTLEHMSRSMAELVRHVSEVRVSNKRLEKDIKELKADVAELKSDVAILKTDVADLKSDVAILKADVAELKSDVAILKADVAELKTDVRQLKLDMIDVKRQQAEMAEKSDYHSGKIDHFVSFIGQETGMLRMQLQEVVHDWNHREKTIRALIQS